MTQWLTILERIATPELRDRGAEIFACDQQRAYELFAQRIFALTVS